MGKLPAGLIAKHVPNGAEIACVTSCDHLVVAGVSNWGAYGLMAALAALLVVTAARANANPPAAQAAQKTTRDKVYSKEQAARGEAQLEAVDPLSHHVAARELALDIGDELESALIAQLSHRSRLRVLQARHERSLLLEQRPRRKYWRGVWTILQK